MSGEQSLERTEIRRRTLNFYEAVYGVDICAVDGAVRWVCDPRRDDQVPGYGCAFTLCAVTTGSGFHVSYAPRHQQLVDECKGRGEPIESLLSRLGATESQLMVFDQERVSDREGVRVLGLEDFGLFEDFFCATQPEADPSGWLQDYFEDGCRHELFVGLEEDGRLVCVCEPPSMPVMQGLIQHTGITTLPTMRRRGYARKCAAFAIHHLIRRGIAPQWDCEAHNLASIALAESVGHERLASVHVVRT